MGGIEYFNGTVDLYPALNPLGLDIADRKIPKLNMHLNINRERRKFNFWLNTEFVSKSVENIVLVGL